MNLLTNLIEWGKIQSGAILFSPEYIELSSIIQDVVELLNISATHKEISIKNEIKEMTIFADNEMIKTILRNIISNSIKFTKNGGKIKITTEEINNEVIIAIKDNGVGIKKEKIEKLFKVDEKVSTYGTKNETGTGLGLIICEEFIEKHGGEILVESKVGKGSTFKIILPNKN